MESLRAGEGQDMILEFHKSPCTLTHCWWEGKEVRPLGKTGIY